MQQEQESSFPILYDGVFTIVLSCSHIILVQYISYLYKTGLFPHQLIQERIGTQDYLLPSESIRRIVDLVYGIYYPYYETITLRRLLNAAWFINDGICGVALKSAHLWLVSNSIHRSDSCSCSYSCNCTNIWSICNRSSSQAVVSLIDGRNASDFTSIYIASIRLFQVSCFNSVAHPTGAGIEIFSIAVTNFLYSFLCSWIYNYIAWVPNSFRDVSLWGIHRIINLFPPSIF